VGGRHILVTTPGFQIGNPLDGLVETSSLLQENSIGFCQPSALFGRQMGLTFPES